jgi:hypothetical protein
MAVDALAGEQVRLFRPDTPILWSLTGGVREA